MLALAAAALGRPAALAAARGGRPCAALARQSVRAFASSAKTAAPDLNALWDAHVDTEFTEKSAASAVATMVSHATVVHVPTLTGGVGTEALEAFYASHFIPKMPADVVITPVERHICPPSSVIDEFIFEFTHTVRMDWMLPGVEPTGKKVRVPFVVVVKFEGDKLSAERIYWDQATVLVQLGLLDGASLPVSGAEQADKVVAMARRGQ